jgi:hypothetical protein
MTSERRAGKACRRASRADLSPTLEGGAEAISGGLVCGAAPFETGALPGCRAPMPGR